MGANHIITPVARHMSETSIWHPGYTEIRYAALDFIQLSKLL